MQSNQSWCHQCWKLYSNYSWLLCHGCLRWNPVFNNWRWVLIFDCVLCLKLCICNRVKHVRHVVIQTWCSDMDYRLSPVTSIFWNKRFNKHHHGIKIFCLSIQFHNYNNGSQKCIPKAVEFSQNNFWLQNLNWAYSGWIVFGMRLLFVCVLKLDTSVHFISIQIYN